MITYSEFTPTSFDTVGLGLPDRQDWILVPVGRNRDSDCLDESNFETALEILGGESETIEVHRFGHWGCGWFDIILAHPDRENEVEEIESALENYPVLDENDHSERQYHAVNDVWEHMCMHDRIEFAVKNGHSIFAARRSAWDCDNACGDGVYSLIGEY